MQVCAWNPKESWCQTLKTGTRGIYLKDASTSGLTAKLEGGILTVNVPKQTEKENVTKIQID